MCARRFLIVVLILTLVAVAGAFAIFQFGQQVLIRQATPKGHFQAPPPRTGPDYAKPDSWIARPGVAKGPASWRPEGSSPRAEDSGRASVFYIHPTTYLRRDRWNASLDDSESRDRAELFVRSQASALADAGDIWAPRYRQAAYGAFLLKTDDAQKALDLAYSDVDAAFAEFLDRVPPSQGIILAAHSQGSLHLTRLLQEHARELGNRLVAAYVVGWPVSTTADLPALGFPACRTALDSGCLLSWMSFAEPANPSLIFGEWEKSRGLTGADRRRKDIVCVNPISGTLGGSAAPTDNPGTLVPSADFRSGRLLPGQVGAHCDEGLLHLDGEIPPLGQFVLPGNNFHVYDYALFWGAIRQDALRRVAAWERR
jgi:hypothetical protein